MAKIKRISLLILALMMALACTCNAFAAISVVQPGEDFYYLDTAGVLQESTKGEIYFCNTQLYEECGAQICIVALDTINGQSTEEYALELANEWGIGSSEKNNGFLLLMAIKEDDYYAIAGSGLQGIFPASVIKEYYDEYLETDFAAKKYDAGAKKFFEAVFSKVADYYNLTLTPQDGIDAYNEYAANGNAGAASDQTSQTSSSSAKSSKSGGSESAFDDDFFKDEPGIPSGVFWFFIIFIVIVIFLVRIAFGSARRRGYGPFFIHHGPGPYDGPHHGPFGGPRHGPFDDGPRHGPGGFGGFGGGHSGGGSSFGGFGGGHSGGGSSFGGGHSGGGGFSGGHSSGGFGGGHSGGGGGFGGGAGRGRH